MTISTPPRAAAACAHLSVAADPWQHCNAVTVGRRIEAVTRRAGFMAIKSRALRSDDHLCEVWYHVALAWSVGAVHAYYATIGIRIRDIIGRPPVSRSRRSRALSDLLGLDHWRERISLDHSVAERAWRCRLTKQGEKHRQ